MRADGSTNRRQFLITTALVTALAGFLLVSSIGGVVEDLRIRDRDAGREAVVRTRILVDNATRFFSQIQSVMGSVAGVASPDQIAAIIAPSAAVRSIFVFDAAGALRLRTTSQIFLGNSARDQAFFAALRAGAKFGVFVTVQGDSPVVVAAQRLEAGTGEFAGALVAQIAIDDVQALYRDAARGGSIALLGYLDDVLAAWPAAADNQSWIGRPTTDVPAFAEGIPNAQINEIIIQQRPRAYIVVAQRIAFGGKLLVSVPRPPFGIWSAFWHPTVVMAVIATLVALSLLMVLHRLALRHDAANAALRASEDVAAQQFAELESLYNNALVGLAYIDKDLRYRRVNALLAQINGSSQESHIGRRVGEAIPELAKVVVPLFRRVLDHGERVVEQEITGSTPADPQSVHTWLANYHPVRDASGTPIGVNVAVQDVTDRKRSEEALRESEQRFRVAAECVSDLIFEWNIRTGAVHWFGDIDSHLGYRPGEIPHTLEGWQNLIHPDDRARMHAAVGEHLAARGDVTAEYRVLERGGGEQIWSARARFISDATGHPILMIGAVADITERRRSVATERRLLDAIEHMSEGIGLWGADDKLIFCNERYRQLSGAAGPMLMPGVKFEEFLRRSMERGLLNEAIGREEDWLRERLFRHRHPSGPIELRREGRWLRVYEHVLPDGGVIIALNDVHAQKQQEEHLRQSQKMEAIGHLTGGVAHDFNNLLAVILGNLEMLEDRAGASKAERDMVAAAMRASRRGAELTQRLLAFARRQPLSPETTDLRVLVDELVPMLRRTLGETIEIASRAQADLGSVTADRGQLENVLINLCVNARDAMPKGGTLTVDLANLDLDSRYAGTQEEVRPGSYVVMAVSDTGTGMTPEVQSRAFEPFFTTKEVGKGSGLGLSTAYGFMKQTGGHITLYSELGHGTTVKLYFPRARSEAAGPAPAILTTTTASTGHETILLVEDDADVRALAATVLGGLGYQVLVASNGPAALDLLAGAGPIDLLLTDVILPGGLLGPALAAEVTRQRPSMRVLYMSGYTEDALIHGGRLDEGVELISKPFRKAELAARIRQILGGGRDG